MNDPLPPPRPDKYLRAEMSAAGREFYRRLAEDGRIATTRCERCERTSFPPRLWCPNCGGEQTWVEIPTQGRLYAFTTQETALRFGAPTVLALVELGPVTVPGIMRAPLAELDIGLEVMVQPFAEPEIGLTLVEFVPGEPAS